MPPESILPAILSTFNKDRILDSFEALRGIGKHQEMLGPASF
jgi:hypothetical protein